MVAGTPLTFLPKTILYCSRGFHSGLIELVQSFMDAKVNFVAVAGRDAALIEDMIDRVCVGDGTMRPYEMMSSSHPGEPLDTVVAFTEQAGK